MNTQTLVLNRNNVVPSTNNTKYIYKFPKPYISNSNEIALAYLNIYYSWANIQSMYNNNVFSYMWWDISGNLTSRQDLLIPDGNYSISSLSSFIQSQMLLRGHYLKNNSTQSNLYFISMIENPTYYACEMSFTAMYALGSSDASNYTNPYPPTQTYDGNGNLIWKGWQLPSTKQYPQVIIDSNYNMKDFLGFVVGYYPSSNTPISTSYDILGTIAPATYPVSAINIQSNFCQSDIAIPNNILYSFSQGNNNYGDLITVEPKNLIWMKIPDGTYSQLELQFIDQDFNIMKILDNQVNIIILIRDQ